MSDLGLVTLMHPDDVTAEHLYYCITDLLTGEDDPLIEARTRKLVPLGGGRQLVYHLGGIFAEIENTMEKKAWPKIQRA